MNRRKFLSYIGCSCGGFLLPSCTTAPITERKQLKIIPEARLNAQAAEIYEKIKEKEKMSDDKETLASIKNIGKKMENSIDEYFNRKQESEADYLGMIFSSLSGYDIRETVKIWERMKELNKGKEPPEFMSTHPSSDNRIKDLNKKMGGVILDYPPIEIS